MNIVLRAHSPLWMGGASTPNRLVKESGILGSLRFWYEGYRHSLGDWECGGPCEDGATPCQTCAFFGCTGRARRFRLHANGLQPVDDMEPHRRAGGGNFRQGWSAFWPSKDGMFEMEIIPRAGVPEADLDCLRQLVVSVARWGGLGAKTQYGFGQVEVVDAAKRSLPGVGNDPCEDDFFSLSRRHFRSFTYTFDNAVCKPWEPRVKIRAHLKDSGQGWETFLGYVKGRDARGSRIHITNLLPQGDGGRQRLKIWFDARDPVRIEGLVDDALGQFELKFSKKDNVEE